MCLISSRSFSPLFACLGTALAYEYKRASLALLIDSGEWFGSLKSHLKTLYFKLAL